MKIMWRILCLIALTINAAHVQASEVSEYNIEKIEQYDQSSSAAPTINPEQPFQFNANVGANGTSTLLSSSTITAPASSAQFFQAGSFGLDFQQTFTSKAAFDAAYPTGTYNLTVNTSTPNTYTGQVVLGSDNYPLVPQIIGLTNATWSGGKIVVTDINQPVTITWNTFNSGSTQGNINLNINNSSIPSQQFAADGTHTSFTFTPSSPTELQNNQSYQISLSFSNIVGNGSTNIPGASSGASYQTDDDFIIQTGTPSSSSSSNFYGVMKDNVVLQTSNAAPVNSPLNTGHGDNAGPYGFSSSYSGLGSVSGPGAGSPYAYGFDAGSGGLKFRYASGSLAALTGAGGLNTLYPDGTYTIKDVNGNAVAIVALTGDVYPNVPKITAVNGNTPTWNGQGQLVLDPSIDNTITWSAFTTTNPNYNYATGGHISVEFSSNNSNSNVDIFTETGFNIQGSSLPFNSVLIPAVTMTTGNSYNGNVQYFLASKINIVGSTPTSGAGYTTVNVFTAVASAPFTSTVYQVRKTNVLQQTSNSAPVNSPLGTTPGQPGPYSFRAKGPTSVSVTGPGSGSPYTLTLKPSNNDYEFLSAAIASQSSLDATYPDGTYTLSDGNNVALTGGIYPNVPQLTAVNGSAPVWNTSGQLELDPTIQNTLTWSAFTTTNSSFTFATGGNEHAQLSGNQDSVAISHMAGLSVGTTTPFNTLVIPPNTLTAGNTYSTTLDYSLASALTSPSANVYDTAAYSTQNYFTVAATFSSSNLNSVIKVLTYQQTSLSAPATVANPYTFSSFGTNPGSVTGPAGAGVPGPYTLAAGSYIGFMYFGVSSYANLAALNTAYPDGAYTLADGTGVTLTGDAFPTAPQLTQVNGAAPVWNAQGQLVLNPGIDNTLTWSGFSGNFATGEEVVVFNGNQDSVNFSLVAFGPGSGSLPTTPITTYTIPAGTLTSGNTYSAGIQYYADSNVTQLGSGSYDVAKYETATNFSVLAGSVYSAEKEHVLQQTSNSAPADFIGPSYDPGPYNFHTFGDAGSTTGPAGSYQLNFSDSDHAYEFFSTGFPTLASLNATYPDGNYTLTNSTVVPLTGDVFPDIVQIIQVNGAPPIWDASGQLNLDPSVTNTLTWTSFTASNGSFNYTTGGYEHINIFSTGSEPTPDNVNINQTEAGTLGNPALNTLTIPASALISGNTYTGSFLYSLASGGTVNPPASAAYLTDTYITIFGTGTSPQTFSNFQTIFNQVVGNAPITLNANATSDQPVTYSVTGPATLTGAGNNILTFTGPGQVTVTANVAGNATYAPANYTQNFNVSPSPPVQQINTLTILHSFGDGTVTNDGSGPEANLIQASDGFFYGTTSTGGSANKGTVFKITPKGLLVIMHSFGDGTVTDDGAQPFASLVQGSDGNFYGTTFQGGSANFGTVYKITPGGQMTILHSFGDGTVTDDGTQPFASLVQGSDGNFYGTTFAGGSTQNLASSIPGSGTVFKITPQGTVTILHSFGDLSVANDGATPEFNLIQATDGNFYGTTPLGGISGGTIFEITPQGTLTILHRFSDGSVAHDGFQPHSALVQSTDGALYGMTLDGGVSQLGSVFKVTLGGQVTILHSFGDGTVTNDGTFPAGNLLLGQDGNFYGTTSAGGLGNEGTLFQIQPQGTETVLHSFADGSVINDGAQAQFLANGVLQGSDGNFYGTTPSGGSANAGIIFKLTPGFPEITSLTTAMGTVSLPFTYQTTTSNVTTGYAATNLPPGLSINALTGLISGTPGTAGTYRTTLTLTSGTGTNTAQITFTIVPLPVPAVTSILYAFGSLNNAFTYSTLATNNTTSYSATGLTGTGLTINAATGVITGTPSTVGTFPVALTAHNATGASPPITVTIQIFATPPTLSQEYVVVHRFNDGSVTFDGQNPFSISQAFSGIFYGATYHGGDRGDGIAYNMTVQGVTTNLATYSTGGGGSTPPPVVAQAPIQGADGNFYFTTEFGGDTTSNGNFGRALLTSNSQGVYSTILHNFSDGSVPNDGSNPQGQPVQGADGSFYGVTLNGGTANEGTIYKITTFGVETVLHNFGDGSVANDGLYPVSALIQGTDGNFYGTTPSGGSAGHGTIFKMTPQGTVTILHSFGDGTVAKDGTYPVAALIQALDGNFYGTTQYGGANGTGVVFKLTSQGMTILHSFNDGSVTEDGTNPAAPLIQGIDGNFYGTTQNGGAGNLGTVFEITSAGTVTIVHSFGDGKVANDGVNPVGGLYQDTSGNFYGTTLNGGAGAGYGTVFVIVATQTTSHAPVFFGSAFAAGAINTPISFTPKTLFGVSGSALGSSDVSAGIEGIIDSVIKDISQETNWTLTGTLPSELTFDSTSGTISGTPLEAGTYTVTLTAHNSFGDGQPETITLYIDVPPAISSLASVEQAANMPFSYQITANPTPTAYGAIGLPGWLSVDTTAGVISGTPPGPGTYSFSATATNYAGTGMLQVTLTVTNDPSAPQIISSTTTNGAAGAPFVYQINATNNPMAYTALILPTGLSFDPVMGMISGTPTTAGTYSIPITASNASGTTAAEVKAIIAPAPAPVISGPLSATVTPGVPYTYQIPATGLVGIYNAVGLPEGLSANPVSGIISGTTTYTGQFPVLVSATNATGTGSATLNLTVGNTLTSFSDWEMQHTISGPATDTPENDSVANLLKYLYDIDPSRPMSIADRAALPILGLDKTTNPGTQYLTLTYRQFAQATGVTVHLEATTDLKTWQTVTPDIDQPMSVDPVTGDPIMEIGVISTGATQFIRLEVTSP